MRPEIARTWLMLPGRPDALPPARTDADVLVVDLEDSVPDAERERARTAVRAAIDDGRVGWVRINGRGTAAWRDDVSALAGAAGLRGVVLAKAESAAEIEDTAAAIPRVPVVPLIESAAGLLRVEEIAAASGVCRVGFGTGDFHRDTGIATTPSALAYARARIAIASAASGLPGPVDGGASGEDPADVRTQGLVALEFGFTAKFCLTEAQVGPLNEALSPDPAEVRAAQALLEAFRASGGRIAGGDDLPRLETARALLARAAAYAG